MKLTLKLDEYPLATTPAMEFGPPRGGLLETIKPVSIEESGLGSDEVLEWLQQNALLWEQIWEKNPEHRAKWLARVPRERALGRAPTYSLELQKRVDQYPEWPEEDLLSPGGPKKPLDPRLARMTWPEIEKMLRDGQELLQYKEEELEAMNVFAIYRWGDEARARLEHTAR